MHASPLLERALATLALLFLMIFIALVVIRGPRSVINVVAITIQCAVLVLLVFGAVVPAVMTMLGAGPLD